MKGLGLSARTMSIIFMVSIIFCSILFGSYVVLSTKLNAVEGYQKLTPIQNSPLCGSGSAHEVPIWSSSMAIDSKPSKFEREVKNQSYSELTGISVPKQESAKPSKPNKYSFLENEIEITDKKETPPPVKREFSEWIGQGIYKDEINVATQGTTVRRPKMTGTKFVKQPRGANSGLGFGTRAVN